MSERMLDKSVNPQYSDLVGFCGTQGEMFDRFNDWVRTKFKTDAEIKFPYGNSYGWCVSHHKKSKLVCNVFPEKDAFSVMVRKTNKQFSEVYDKVSEQAKEVIDNKYPCNDGGWIHLRVTDEASYADIVKIME